MITQLVVYWILLVLKKKYRLTAADLSRQKALDADPKAIQQIVVTSKSDNQIRVYYILEQSKETKLEFAKGTTNVAININD